MFVMFLLGCRPAAFTEVSAPPLPVAGDSVSLVVVGDVGKGNDGQRRVAQAMAAWCNTHSCDALLLLGDNLYPDGMESPDDPNMDRRISQMYRPLNVPLYLAVGNHDFARSQDSEPVQWQLEWAERTEGVELPARYYSFRAGSVATIAVLDTDTAWWWDWRVQGFWLDQLFHDDTSTWQIVMGHHPFRSDGKHGNAGYYDGVPALGGALNKLFSRHVCPNADLYLAGHEHTRQHLQRCGLDLVVSGAGATATKIVDRGNDPTFASDRLGFAWLDLTSDSGRLVFVNEDGKADYEADLQPR
jgi:tartrate-resistant acid phosphatase type 5